MASPSKTVKVESAAQFNDLLKKSKIVVTDCKFAQVAFPDRDAIALPHKTCNIVLKIGR